MPQLLDLIDELSFIVGVYPEANVPAQYSHFATQGGRAVFRGMPVLRNAMLRIFAMLRCFVGAYLLATPKAAAGCLNHWSPKRGGLSEPQEEPTLLQKQTCKDNTCAIMQIRRKSIITRSR